MKKHFKDFFIPHAENNYHPHLLHTKRAAVYSAFFFATKIIIVGTALLIPVQVFVSPDMLAKQERQLVQMTNTLRSLEGVEILEEDERLVQSSGRKTQDMIDHAYFSHVGPDGHDLDYFLSLSGYAYDIAGENLAMGFDSAERMFAAWLASPSHYSNIVDSDFEDIGINLRGGIYNGEPIVFAAIHFGTPETTRRPVAIERVQDVFEGQIYELDSERRAAPRFDDAKSYAALTQDGERTRIDIHASIAGDIASARATVGQEEILLSAKTGELGIYSGSVMLPPDNASYRNILPTIQILGANGDMIQTVLAWQEPPPAASSRVQSYWRAKTALSDMSLFSWSTYLYLGAALLFAIALIMKVFIRMHYQHPHVIVQTLCLILFLLTLALV